MFKKRLLLILIVLLITLIIVGGCRPGLQVGEGENSSATPGLIGETVGEDEVSGAIRLPRTDLREGSVAEALYYRVSSRNYSEDALNLDQVGALLWAAGGLNIDGAAGATRTLPSAGATYPLEFYLLAGKVTGLDSGIYHYDHINHALHPLVYEDRRTSLAAAALDQNFIAHAPAVIVMIAYFERTTARYGERGERYVYMDVGYASQNIYLMATELGLATVAVGAYDDGAVTALLLTDGEPLLIMPVGVPLP